jgi:hypothetical protein
MYIITRKSEYGNLFYQFSSDETDLYCVATDNLQSCRKYSDEEKKRLENNKLLQIRGVKFQKVWFTLNAI